MFLYLRPIQGMPFWWAGVVVAGLGDGRLWWGASRIIQDLLLHSRDLSFTQHFPCTHSSVTAPTAIWPVSCPPPDRHTDTRKYQVLIACHMALIRYTRDIISSLVHIQYKSLMVSAHWNFRMLKNKYDLTLWQSRLHTASETFVRHKKIGKGSIFCVFASILIEKDEEYEKTSDSVCNGFKTCENWE